ncbi:hypothetical protein FGO68_gene7809 [Halteria grandinella]|uniref:Uncharacterized protein n=1 Tax=Halteria grandinella TaxID=5974 RepID=A0A8J8NH49_HALGN|nr:hypothetical protein FGO68_gene7809 [Halteria grandinella]
MLSQHVTEANDICLKPPFPSPLWFASQADKDRKSSKLMRLRIAYLIGVQLILELAISQLCERAILADYTVASSILLTERGKLSLLVLQRLEIRQRRRQLCKCPRLDALANKRL